MPGDDATLSERQSQILNFAKRDFNRSIDRDNAIRLELGLTVTRYYQLLGVIVDSPFALTAEPMLVRRLQRMRDQRLAERTRLAPEPLSL